MDRNSENYNLDGGLDAFNAILDMTVSLNSIGCLLEFARVNAYKFVILDEMSLLWRHLVRKVTRCILLVAWDKFVNIINFADNLIKAQEGITENNTALVTNLGRVLSQDRTRVRAFCFKKPPLLHPIQFINHQKTALIHLMEECKKLTPWEEQKFSRRLW